MFAEAATSDTAGAFTDATMHATSTKQVLQAGVFHEADGASMSSGKARDPSFARLFVCLGLSYPDLVSTFVSPIQKYFSFRI